MGSHCRFEILLPPDQNYIFENCGCGLPVAPSPHFEGLVSYQNFEIVIRRLDEDLVRRLTVARHFVVNRVRSECAIRAPFSIGFSVSLVVNGYRGRYCCNFKVL